MFSYLSIPREIQDITGVGIKVRGLSVSHSKVQPLRKTSHRVELNCSGGEMLPFIKGKLIRSSKHNIISIKGGRDTTFFYLKK